MTGTKMKMITYLHIIRNMWIYTCNISILPYVCLIFENTVFNGIKNIVHTKCNWKITKYRIPLFEYILYYNSLVKRDAEICKQNLL